MNAKTLVIGLALAGTLSQVPIAGTRTRHHGDIVIEMTACRREPYCALAVDIQTPSAHHSVAFNLGEGGPSWVEARPLQLPGTTAFSLVAIAAGGSDQHFETAIITVVDGTVREVLPAHLRTSSQDLVCLGHFGTGRKLGLLSATFAWEDEAHYDVHRYAVSHYEWNGQAFSELSNRTTGRKHANSRSAIQEFGYRCERDLISWTLGTEGEAALEGTNDG